MPKLTELASNDPIKMLVVGDSGAGKTGALASLAKAGYTLHIADFDNGLDPLAEQLRDDPKALERVLFESYSDDYKNNRVIAKAAAKFAKDLDGESAIGPVTEFDQNHVLVIDSLTALSKAILHEVLRLAGQTYPRQNDWGEAINRLERIIAKLCSSAIKCHVIVLAHLTADKTDDGAVIKYYPKAVSANQSRDIARFFNTVAMVRQIGTGSKVRRVIVHTPQPRVDLKNPFRNVPEEIPISEGYLPFIEARKQKETKK